MRQETDWGDDADWYDDDVRRYPPKFDPFTAVLLALVLILLVTWVIWGAFSS